MLLENAQFLSEKNSITLSFSTDMDYEFAGFSITYEAVDPNDYEFAVPLVEGLLF